jgi:DNA-directed RNA polymerase subunit RPC12/RpoP
MSGYTCARCDGQSGMQGHFGAFCHHRTGTLADRMTKFHFCCPGDCELVENVLPRPSVRTALLDICTSSISPGAMIGVACPSCGHSDLVHPGIHNPTVDACLLCMLQVAVDRAEEGSP